MRNILPSMIALALVAACGNPSKTTEEETELSAQEEILTDVINEAAEPVIENPENTVESPSNSSRKPIIPGQLGEGLVGNIDEMFQDLDPEVEEVMKDLGNTELGNAMALVIGENCISCHSAEENEEITDFTVVANVIDMGASIAARIDDGSMPQDDELTELEMNVVAAWAKANFPAPGEDIVIASAADRRSLERETRVCQILADRGIERESCKDILK